MWRSGSKRCGLSRRGGVFLLLALGCGKTVALGHGVDQASGGTSQAGVSQGGSGAISAGSGAIMDMAGAAGDAGSEGGVPGAAGQPNPDISFYLVPALAPPAERSPDVQPGDAMNTEIIADRISADGSLVVGTSRYTFNRQDGRVIDEEGSASFYWTRETGTQTWYQVPDARPAAVCMTHDGSVALGGETDGLGNLVSFFRWSKAVGFESLVTEWSSAPPWDVSCSADLGAAIGISLDPIGPPRPWIWRPDLNGASVTALALPGLSPEGQSVRVGMSADGSGAFINVYDVVARNSYRWTTDGAVELETPAGYQACSLTLPYPLLNADGSVLLAHCENGGTSSTVFRWTAATNSMVALPDAPQQPFWMNGSGTVVLGRGGSGSIVLWKDGSAPVITMTERAFNLLGVVADGSAVFGEVIHSDQAGASAVRWTEADRFVELPGLPGDAISRLAGYSADGSLAVGASQKSGTNDRRAVLWDSQGVRDIAGELEAAGVDLQSVEALEPERVWVGSPIVVQGTGYIDNYFEYKQIWFAELPVRE